MIELSRAIVIDEKDFVVDSKTTIYPLTISVFKKKTTLFALKPTEKEKWVLAIKGAIGYSSIHDIYNILVSFCDTIHLDLLGKRRIWRSKVGRTSRNKETSCFENI